MVEYGQAKTSTISPTPTIATPFVVPACLQRAFPKKLSQYFDEMTQSGWRDLSFSEHASLGLKREAKMWIDGDSNQYKSSNSKTSEFRIRALLTPEEQVKWKETWQQRAQQQILVPQAACDPGVDVFLTAKIDCEDGQFELQLGKGTSQRIEERFRKKKSSLQSYYSREHLSESLKLELASAMLENSKRRAREIRKLHEYAIQLLFAMATVIYLPPFDTARMTLRKKRLSANVTRRMLSLKHAEFRNLVQRRARNTGIKRIIFVTEEHTSKTCGSCGVRHPNLGPSKVHFCHSCKCCEERDGGAARKILMKSLDLVHQFVQLHNRMSGQSLYKQTKQPQTLKVGANAGLSAASYGHQQT